LRREQVKPCFDPGMPDGVDTYAISVNIYTLDLCI
jgi:hypothetical protein